MKKGDRNASKLQEIPMREYEKITLQERQERHKALHPNDDNIVKVNDNGEPVNGITWNKAGKHTKKMDKFYKEHIYTFIDRDMNKAWVRVAGFEEEE
tara:strand:+ start:2517 stop:2807 length:291 start_codon:yes stop_codon:yes gene_type:complete